jgi:hypothetical protein
MYTRTITIDEEDVLREADEIIAGELDELNRPSRYCYTPTEIGRTYGMSGSDLNSFLMDRKIIYKELGCYHIARKYRGLRLTAYRYTMRYNRYGHRKLKASLVWTEEGRQFILDLIRN